MTITIILLIFRVYFWTLIEAGYHFGTIQSGEITKSCPICFQIQNFVEIDLILVHQAKIMHKNKIDLELEDGIFLKNKFKNKHYSYQFCINFSVIVWQFNKTNKAV